MAIDDLITPGPLKDRYTVGPIVGQGGYSTVRVAHEIGTNKKVAVKYVMKSNAFSDMNLEVECRLLRRLGQHNNINSFLGLYEEGDYYLIVLEYLQGGEMLDILVKRIEANSTPYSELQVAVMLRQIVSAVEHCHKFNIIHRDLKPENLLVSDKETLSQVDSLFHAPLKLADFGLAAELPPGTKLTQTCGTPNYMAPERLSRKAYDLSSDIWSIGVIMYILLSGSFPFYGDTDREIRACTLDQNQPVYGEEFASLSEPCMTLLRDMLLAKDPAKRPTATEVLAHPWMTGELASTAELQGALQQLKRFNTRRKFLGCIRALVASRRLQRMLGRLHGEQLVLDLTQYGVSVDNVISLSQAFAKATNRTYHCNKDMFLDVLVTELDMPTGEMLEGLFHAMADQEGMINTRDFCMSLGTKLSTNDTQTLWLCFHIYDTDGSGTIDQHEYADMVRSIVRSLGETFAPNDLWLQQEFESMDTDCNGQLSGDEFVVAAKNNIKIQKYLKTMDSLIHDKNREARRELTNQIREKCGDLNVRKYSVLSGLTGWKARYGVVQGNTLYLYRSQCGFKNKVTPVGLYDLINARVDTKVEPSPKRGVGRMKLETLRDKVYLEPKNNNELKAWIQIFKDMGDAGVTVC